MSIKRTAAWRILALHWWIWRRRWDNWRWDKEARWKGFCNDKPWRPMNSGQGHTGGYLHWRCARMANHEGRHRYINYTWVTDGRVQYDPMPSTGLAPRPLRDRHMVMTWREARANGQWLRAQYAKALSRE